MARFMLLIRGGNDGMAASSPAEIEAVIGRYFAWSDQLRREGRLISADELGEGGRTLRARDGQIAIDGPYPETKEAIGGYYLFEAADEDEAIAVARGCPALAHGGLVDLRPVVEH